MIRILLSILLLASVAIAQNSNNQPSASPLQRADTMSAQAKLENMLVKRYTQELSSIVGKEYFNIGAKLSLGIEDSERNPAQFQSPEPFSDLELGYLDADEMFEDYALPNMAGVNPLEKYTIDDVSIQVGLKEGVGDEIKASVEEWLEARVGAEFGTRGNFTVQFIQNPKEVIKATPKASWLSMVKDMQGLLGNLILALAIIFGVLIWRMLMGKESETSSAPVNISSKTEAMLESGSGAGNAANNLAQQQTKDTLDKISHISEQVLDLSPKISDQLNDLVGQWCEQGEDGMFQLACFAEISGKVLGSLPIPKEHKKQMGNIFSQMHELPNEKRLEIVNRVYWDMVSSLNLGTDALHRPFSFISNSGLGTLNKVLLGNDSDTQTVVTMYMPDNTRKSYFNSLDENKKVELLQSAAKLSSISEDNLHSIEDQIAPYFEEKIEDSQVSMSLTLSKLIDVMSFVDACSILPTLKGAVIDNYKYKTPHIAFLSEWNSEGLSRIAKKVSNEELLAYMRVVPEMASVLMGFVPPRAQRILADDLDQSDYMSAEEKEILLSDFNETINELIENGEIEFSQAMSPQELSVDKGLKIAS